MMLDDDIVGQVVGLTERTVQRWAALLSEDELAEWNAAVEEYRQQRRARRRWKR